jgi:hypothetical protein
VIFTKDRPVWLAVPLLLQSFTRHRLLDGPRIWPGGLRSVRNNSNKRLRCHHGINKLQHVTKELPLNPLLPIGVELVKALIIPIRHYQQRRRGIHGRLLRTSLVRIDKQCLNAMILHLPIIPSDSSHLTLQMTHQVRPHVRVLPMLALHNVITLQVLLLQSLLPVITEPVVKLKHRHLLVLVSSNRNYGMKVNR